MTVFTILKFLSNFITQFAYLSILSIYFSASVVAIVLQFVTGVILQTLIIPAHVFVSQSQLQTADLCDQLSRNRSSSLKVQLEYVLRELLLRWNRKRFNHVEWPLL